MPLLPEPRITNAATNYLTGMDLGRTRAIEDMDRQTQMQAGQMAASGDLAGASKAFFKGGQFDRGLATQNAIQKMSDDHLEKALQVQDRLARLASTIETPEQFEMAKARLRSMGLPISDKITFEQLPQLRAESLSVADQMALAMKERELTRKEAAQPAYEFTKTGVGNKFTGDFKPYSGSGQDPEFTLERGKFEQQLRKEYTDLSKDFKVTQDATNRIKTGAKLDNSVGDLSLIYGYMKLLDPGSVVRETEFATAENAQGVPDQVRNVWNRIINGERLTPDMRQKFVTAAEELSVYQTQRQRQVRNQFEGIVKNAGSDPSRVLMNEGLDLGPDRLRQDPNQPQSRARTETVKATEILNKPAPQGAVDLLKADPSPEAQKEFDEVFGAGASQRALGGR